VQLVRKYLANLGVSTTDFERVFETYKLDYARKLLDMDKSQRDLLEDMEKQTQELLSPLADEVTPATPASVSLPPLPPLVYTNRVVAHAEDNLNIPMLDLLIGIHRRLCGAGRGGGESAE
jgi:hypothetical protein